FIRSEGEEAPTQEALAQKKQKEPESAGVKEKKPQAETERPATARAEQEEIASPQQKRGERAVSAALDEEKQQKPEPPGREPEQPRVKASPVARRIAAELGVDLSSVKGTGPEGRVTETDVRAAVRSQPEAAGVSPAGKQSARLPLQT